MAEHDQILVPVDEAHTPTSPIIPDGYETYSVLALFGLNRRALRRWANYGLSPLHFITQRGPYQDGETALDMRLDPRTVQLVMAEPLFRRMDFWDRRDDLLDLLRPSRSFNTTTRPLILRKWLPAGKIERGSDLVTTAGSPIVTSATGRFVERGLEAGQRFDITTDLDIGSDTVASVENDYTVTLSTNCMNTATDVGWRFRRGIARRDLYCLLSGGLVFDQGPDAAPLADTGYYEVLRFIAHDPCWYSAVELTQAWGVDATGVDLVFDGLGAWCDAAGRWQFYDSYVGETVSIYYWGTAAAKPTIEITGPALQPSIENDTTGVSIALDYQVSDGEVVTIDTLALTVENAAGDNLMPYMSGDLARFALEPEPQAPNRQNDVIVRFGGGTLDSAAVIKWKNRYIGI